MSHTVVIVNHRNWGGGPTMTVRFEGEELGHDQALDKAADWLRNKVPADIEERFTIINAWRCKHRWVVAIWRDNGDIFTPKERTARSG